MPEENITNDNLPENESSVTAPSIPELEKFIFQGGKYDGGVVPRNLSAPEVAKFLIGRIEKTTPLKSFLRVEMVAKFYETFEIVEKFKQFLDKKESGEEEVRRSIVIARIIAYLGKTEDVDFAKQYYKYLIEHVDSTQGFEDLIFLYDAFGTSGDIAPLRNKFQTKLTALEAKKNSDYQAELEYLNFEENIRDKLVRAEKAQQVKGNILNITDRRKRIDEEIKMYLSLDYGFLDYLQPWAIGRLRRETWALQPGEHILRDDNPKFKGDVAKSFRDFLGKIDGLANREEEGKDSLRLRLLRAIKFFDGKVSAEEESFLKQYKGQQLDVLANEGFMLP